MQQGPSIEVPGQQVRPPRELVVLIRLIDGDREAKPPHVSGLQLAHGSVDGILRSSDDRCASPRIDQVHLDPKPERLGQPHRGLERGQLTPLHKVDQGA